MAFLLYRHYKVWGCKNCPVGKRIGFGQSGCYHPVVLDIREGSPRMFTSAEEETVGSEGFPLWCPLPMVSTRGGVTEVA